MINGPFSPWPSFTAEEADAVQKVLLSNKVNYWTGRETRQFEAEFAAFAGTRYAVPERDDLILTTGNAGGLYLYLNGVQKQSFGQNAQVRRNINLSKTILAVAKRDQNRSSAARNGENP